MSEDYIEGVFDSCKGVTMPSSGDYAMDMACGDYGSKYCTAKLWVCMLNKCQNLNSIPLQII